MKLDPNNYKVENSDPRSWVQSIFTIGNQRELTEDDVFPIDPRLQSERLTALLEQ